MKIPNVTIQQLLEAGVHLGHKTLRWNPKMKKYIFGKRDSIHIIDLTQTLELTKIALEKVGIKAIDEKTLRVNLKNPTPFFLGLLSHYSNFQLRTGGIKPTTVCVFI